MTHSTGIILPLLASSLLFACASTVSSNSDTKEAQASDSPVAQAIEEKLPESEARPSGALIAQSEDNHLKVQNGAAALLRVPRVELAPEAFTRVNRLLLERRPFKDGQGHPLMGRSLESPTVLLLERMGEDCYLRLENSERRVLIPGLRCRASVP